MDKEINPKRDTSHEIVWITYTAHCSVNIQYINPSNCELVDLGLFRINNV